MKKIYLLLLSIILFIPNIVLANSISNINMDIYVDNNGTAHVTEEWTAKLNKGTEGYKPYYNLGTSEISNFKVSMNNKEFTYLDNWNVEQSFDYKKYKNGLHYINNGVELCFGVSEYGKNTYKLTYDISNFIVRTSDDYQMIYWTLFPYDYDPLPKNVYIKIYSDFKYSDTLPVWGYGKYGAPCYVHDGYIEMDSDGKLKRDEYMTILVKFPQNSFNTSVTLNDTFSYYYIMSQRGAIKYESKNNILSESLVHIFTIIVFILFFGVPIIKIFSELPKKKKSGRFMGDKIKVKDVPYYRDIPYNTSDISRIYWMAEQYNLTKKRDSFLGAIFLKWMKNGNILINNSSNNEKIIILNNSNNIENKEFELYDMLLHASENNILTKKNFTNWCKNNYSKFLNWFDSSLQDVRISMANAGYIFNEDYNNFVIGPLLNEEAKKIIGLKKYLNDFSKISDKNSKELVIWQDYLIYALIFGIADTVMDEFNEIYPNIIPSNIYNDISFIENIAEKLYTVSFNEEIRNGRKEEANTNIGGFSSGGGGFSSGGGGGGSFGGGGGGGGGFR